MPFIDHALISVCGPAEYIRASREVGKANSDLSNQIRSRIRQEISRGNARTATYALTTCLATLFAKSQRDFGEYKRGQIGKAKADLTYLHRCTRTRGRLHVHVCNAAEGARF